MSDPTPRGIRLNNPGNIRKSADKWQGLAAEQTDSAFATFIAPEWGVRALVKLLIGYEKRGYNTVRAIINRYAPPVENATSSYVDHVAAVVGVDPDTEIDVDSYRVMKPLVVGIILHENGRIIPQAQIEEGLRLGGVHDAPAKPLLKKAGGKIIAGTATTLALAGQVVEPVQKAAEGLAPFAGSPIVANITMGLLTIAGGAFLASTVADWLKTRKGL